MDARGRTNGVYYGKYVGELKDGYYHGKGTFTYDNDYGDTYVGKRKNNRFHGRGTMTSSYIYTGEWRNGKKTKSWPRR